MKHFVVKIIGGDKIGEGGLYYIAQGRTKWSNCRLAPKTPDYQLGWAVLAASRLLDTLTRNFHFM